MIAKIKRFKKGKISPSFGRKKDTTYYKNIFFPVILGLVILAAISFLVITDLRMNKKRLELNLKIENLRKEIGVLEKKKQELSAGISQIPTEGYLEKEARERFNLKKPGEEVVVVLPPEEIQEEKPEEQRSFWQRILEKLGL